MKNIVEYLEHTQACCGEKTAIIEPDGRKISFSELWNQTVFAANGLSTYVKKGTPVLVCMEKSIDCIEAFLATAMLGGFYIPVDITLPYHRILQIVSAVNSRLVITRRCDVLADEIKENCEVLYIEDLLANGEQLPRSVQSAVKGVLATDPLYAIFTSGSTGVPKGVITTHQALFSFIDEMGERFGFSSEDTFANQVPFYFDASTKDIYLTLKYGCTMCIIPKKLFMMPKQLMQFLNDNHVTRIVWAPSLLCIAAKMKALEKCLPMYLRSVFFVGELMPTQQYNVWKSFLPDVQFVNLYGCTEVTGSSLYYVIERELDNADVIPIGEPFDNMDVFLLDNQNKIVTDKMTEGEICLRGTSLSLGYYGEREMTERVFCQNPLNHYYPERIYRSGDIGRYNEYGELVYVCRKDYQIKRMGRRIELGDVEAAISALDGIDRVCCLFDAEKQEIITIVSGSLPADQLRNEVKERLPVYMVPNIYEYIDEFPLNQNGKIDRGELKRRFLGGSK